MSAANLDELERILDSLGAPLQRSASDSDVIHDRVDFYVATTESVHQAGRIIAAVNALPGLIAKARAFDALGDSRAEGYEQGHKAGREAADALVSDCESLLEQWNVYERSGDNVASTLRAALDAYSAKVSPT